MRRVECGGSNAAGSAIPETIRLAPVWRTAIERQVMKVRSESNFSRIAVPASERKPVAAMVVFLSGLYNTLPVYALASAIVLGLGFVQGALAIVAGAAIAVVIASATAYIGGATGLTTYNINIHTFGRRGSVLVNAIVNIGAIGWYGLTLGFFALALDAAVRFAFSVNIPLPVYTVGAGVATTATVLYGFNAMDWLNRLAIPVLAAFLVWIGYETVNTASLGAVVDFAGAPDAQISSFAMGMTAMIGLASASASAMPDVMRFARSGRGAIAAVVLTLLLTAPVLMSLSAMPVVLTGGQDFVANVLSLDLGLAAVVIVILATWTTNIINVYAGSLSMARLAPGLKEVHATLICGAAGIAIALMNITEDFIAFFTLLGVTMPPIAGVYIAHYFLSWRRAGGAFHMDAVAAVRPLALAAWIAGSGVAYSTQYAGQSLTGVAAVDGVLVAGLVFTILWALNGLASLARRRERAPSA